MKMRLPKTALFANEGLDGHPGDFFGIMVANEYRKDTESWVQLSPFGRFPNVQGMQVFNPEDGELIANEFDAAANALARGLGLPWYIGHPDHPLFKDYYTDTKAYGRIKAVECRHDKSCSACKEFANSVSKVPCREHGLFGKVKWNSDGRVLIANESFHGHSVNWRLRKVGNEWHPFSLKSVGFTNEPGIPVPPIYAANEAKNMNFIEIVRSLLKLDANTDEAGVKTALETMCNEYQEMKKKKDAYAANETLLTTLVAKLKEASITVPDSGVLEFMANELIAKTKAATDLATEKATAEANFANEQGKVTAETAKVTAEKARADKAETDLATAKTTMANERKNRAKDVLDLAITAGVITQAERTQYETEMANESTFEATLTKIKALKPKLNTQSQLGSLGQRSSDTVDRTQRIINMVNERIAKNKSEGKDYSYDACFAQIKQENAGLFQEMKQPEGAKK